MNVPRHRRDSSCDRAVNMVVEGARGTERAHEESRVVYDQ